MANIQAASNHIYIAVMGPTGAGKSSLINLLSGSDLKVSDSLDSCTQITQTGTPVELHGRTVHLIDTPGFDNSSRSQIDVLKDIASYLGTQYKNGTKLHGVLYLHRISDNRVGGITRRDFDMFRQLVGVENLKNVIIVTTMWDKITPQQGAQYVANLSTDSNLFKPTLDRGALMHHLKVLETTQEIIQHIIKNEPLPLEIQIELVDQRKDISQTAAYKEAYRQLVEQFEKTEIAHLHEDTAGVGTGPGIGNTSVTRGGLGFPAGSYFVIRERGTKNCLTTCYFANTEGIQVQLWPEQTNDAQVFFIDEAGALCHAGSGLAVDIVDDVPCLRRRRPVVARPNPWSHPLPLFSYENSQICVKFLSDPAVPRCSEELYPNDSWSSDIFVLATRSEKTFHMHPISDFAAWIPSSLVSGMAQDIRANYDKTWRVLVEPKTGDHGGDRTSWDIVRAP